MSEITVRQDAAPTTAAAPLRLMDWAQEAHAAHELAGALCATSFCPDAFRGKPGEATAAILAGSEVGLSPMAALNAYDVIQGRPAPKAITLRALVQSAGHDVWLESSTPTKAVMRGRRRGSQQVQESVWDMDRARGLKLTNKPNWQNQPQAMLVARATSEIARLVGADVILGIPYSAEELADEQPAPVATLRRTTTAEPKRTARRAPAPAPEPDLEPPPLAADDPIPTDDEPQSEPTEATITRDQLTRLHASFGDLGITDRDDRLRYASGVLGHDVESSKDLTKTEASQVLDAINTDLSGGAA
jgi:hypothetical protein